MTLALADLVDVSTLPAVGPTGELELDLTTTQIRGARVALEWVVRAWFTPRGALRWARAKGFDLRQMDNASLDETDLEQLRAALEEEARRVEYVESVSVAVTLSERTTTIEGEVALVDGRAYSLAVTLAEGAAVLVEVGA